MAGPWLGLAGGLLGGAASAYGAKQQQDFEAAQAQKQMDFQERMSSTIYQRGTADMRAAGLNPILAAGNVSTPGAGGAMAEGQNIGGAFASGAEGGASSALAAVQNVKQLGIQDAQRQLLSAQASAQRQAALLDATRATNEASGEGNVSYQVLQNQARWHLVQEQIEQTRAAIQNMRSSSALNAAALGYESWRSRYPALAQFGPSMVGGLSSLASSAARAAAQ